MKKEAASPGLNWFCLILLVGFLLAAARSYVLGLYRGGGYPDNTFLFLPADHFNDLFNVSRASATLNPYGGENPSGQFPFLNLITFFFSKVSPTLSVLLFSAVCVMPLFGALLHFFRRIDRAQALTCAVIITFLTYPMQFTLDRANFEGWIFSALLLFVLAFRNERYRTAALLLAFATALKGYPIVFGLLLLQKRKYIEFVVAGALAALASVVSLALFEGGLWINLDFLLTGKNLVHPAFQGFLYRTDLVQRSVSLYTLAKLINLYGNLNLDLPSVLKWYKGVSLVSGLALCAYCYLRERVLWRQLFILTAAILLLPQLSADYKLLHLLLPALILLDSERNPSWPYVLGLAVLLIPKPYVALNRVISDGGVHDITIGVLVNIVLLVALSVMLLWPGRRNAVR